MEKIYVIEILGESRAMLTNWGADLRICQQGDDRVIRRESIPGSFLNLKNIVLDDLNQEKIVKELLHYTGNPFIDEYFPPKKAFQITKSEAERLIELNSNRRKTDYCHYRSELDRIQSKIDSMVKSGEFSSLPLDEQKSLKRLLN